MQFCGPSKDGCRGLAVRATMVSIYLRAVFLTGCFTMALLAGGVEPQPLKSGPLEDRATQLVVEFFSGSSLHPPQRDTDPIETSAFVESVP
jgi:hypothetical protein